ncbi:MAG: Card1-like endonuclease domain-containing protein [Rectinema subterraneum]|uniref:Card1-like endonuclease domain-containing protein n=1 Tax=Rectinema subterraneum TaxID=2653714 RepID=UPI003C7BC2B4
MKKTLLTLLSDQVVPSALFISSLAERGDDVFVITTQKMKDKSKISDLGKSLHGTHVIREIIVQNEDSISEVSKFLDAIRWQEYDTAFVDLTLGTKIMSLAVHSYFRRFDELYSRPRVSFFYQPAGKNCIKRIDADDVINPRLLSLDEYLSACGITAINRQEACIAAPEITRAVMSEYSERWDNAGKLFRKLRNAKKPKLSPDKSIPLREGEMPQIILQDGAEWCPTAEELHLMQCFCSAAHFDIGFITKKQIEYLSGGWLEEWFYHKVLETMPELGPEQIALSLHIKTRAGLENELDVALVNHRNAFRHAECKTSLESDQSGSSFLIETLYKQSAIRKNFGLTSSSIIVTIDKIKGKNALDRAQDLDLKIIHHEIIYDEDALKRELVAWLK